MTKLIKIPDEILIDLKVLAAKKNISLKAYIELELVKIVDISKSKKLKK